MEFIGGVPQELITEILALLPAKSLLRLQCLSKLWFALINDPYFINMHFENNNRERSLIVEIRSYFEETCFYLIKFSNDDRFRESVKIFPPFYRPENPNDTSVICCNSLVCILNHDLEFCTSNFDYEIVIWNPSIQKYKKLPFEPIDDRLKRPVFDSLYDHLQLNLAFGYDRVNNDYKVLKIVFVIRCSISSAISIDPSQIMVYSLKAHSWTRVEDSLPCNVESFEFQSEQAFSNGAFHWLGNIKTRAPTLLAFDLTTHKFAVQTIPIDLSPNSALVVLEGSLGISMDTWDEGIVVWMMKEYGVTSSWSRLYAVDLDFLYRQSDVFSKYGEKVLIKDSSFELFWYDIKNKTHKRVELENDRHIISKKFWATSCVESLILLDSDNDN